MDSWSCGVGDGAGPLLRAVSYVRVSTLDQTRRGDGPDGLSVPAQREANRRRAADLGALVAAEFVERGRSGRSMERPELKRMLDYVESHSVDFVIVHKIDRLARNRADDAAITAQIAAAGTRLVSTSEAISPTPSGRLLHGIMASIAEFYSQNLATEVLKGMREKAIQGGTPGRAPIGYLNQRAAGGNGQDVRTVGIDPVRGPLIRWAFTAYATGEWTCAELAAELASRGLVTRPGPSRSPVPLGAKHCGRVLRNPYYKGVVTFNGVEHAGAHEPLTDDGTWATVQGVLAARRTGERSRKHDHYLKGTVFCAGCGRRLILQHTVNRSGRVYEYFVCPRRATGCPQRKALPIASVEERVAQQYRRLALAPHERVLVEEAALAELRAREEPARIRLDGIAGELERIGASRAKLFDAYYSEAWVRDVFLAEQRRLKKEQFRLEAERVSLDPGGDGGVDEMRAALDVLESIPDAYDAATASARKLLSRAVFARILFGGEPTETRAELNEPYASLTAARSAIPRGTA
jgi:DNA invertase Pin-like site-specific DNA recombinase